MARTRPTYRRVVTPEGRTVTLGSASGRSSTQESAVYTGNHRTTHESISIRRENGRWIVRVFTLRLPQDSSRTWLTIAHVGSLAEAAEYVR